MDVKTNVKLEVVDLDEVEDDDDDVAIQRLKVGTTQSCLDDKLISFST